MKALFVGMEPIGRHGFGAVPVIGTITRTASGGFRSPQTQCLECRSDTAHRGNCVRQVEVRKMISKQIKDMKAAEEKLIIENGKSDNDSDGEGEYQDNTPPSNPEGPICTLRRKRGILS